MFFSDKKINTITYALSFLMYVKALTAILQAIFKMLPEFFIDIYGCGPDMFYDVIDFFLNYLFSS